MTLFQRLIAINPARSYEGMTRELRRLRKEEGKQKIKDAAIQRLRVGYLDIETSNLKADFGIILSWYIKAAGEDHYDFSIINKKELFEYKFDRRVVRELLGAFKNYDILYVHYGSDMRFDIPFIRTRAFEHGFERLLPRPMEKFIIDTYPIARHKLKLHSNRLDSIADMLRVPITKTVISPRKWNLARVGHPGALRYVAEHNKRDVQILEGVHQKLKAIERPIYRSM